MSIHEKMHLIIACLLLPSLGGCAPILLATGAVAGYAVSRDSVLLDLDQPWDAVWNAAQQEIQGIGRVKKENPKRGRLDAHVDDADVVVTLKQLTPSTVRLAVRARKNLLPKVDVAQKVAFGIQRRLKDGGGLF